MTKELFLAAAKAMGLIGALAFGWLALGPALDQWIMDDTITVIHAAQMTAR